MEGGSAGGSAGAASAGSADGGGSKPRGSKPRGSASSGADAGCRVASRATKPGIDDRAGGGLVACRIAGDDDRHRSRRIGLDGTAVATWATVARLGAVRRKGTPQFVDRGATLTPAQAPRHRTRRESSPRRRRDPGRTWTDDHRAPVGGLPERGAPGRQPASGAGTVWNRPGSASPGSTRISAAGRSPSVARPRGPSSVSESSDSDLDRIVTCAPGVRALASR